MSQAACPGKGIINLPGFLKAWTISLSQRPFEEKLRGGTHSAVLFAAIETERAANTGPGRRAALLSPAASGNRPATPATGAQPAVHIKGANRRLMP